MPDFEGLAMFAKVAEERSFAGAARSMGVSVATVSRGVSRLEERLGARLFNRTSRQLALTSFGLTLAERAARLYAEAEEAESTGREASVRPRGLIRLAVGIAFGLRQITPILPEFLREYPEISIDLHLSDAKTDIVGEGFDAALRITSKLDDGLTARKLCPVSHFVVASPDYLARHGRPRHPRDLDGRDCLSYANAARQDVWQFHNRLGDEVDISPRGRLRVTTVDALIPAIMAGLALAELPGFIAAEYLASGQMEAVLMDWSLPLCNLYFVTPTARTRPAKIEALAEFLAKRLSTMKWD
jgi:DNA-binding transcriptional LysR family regulator